MNRAFRGGYLAMMAAGLLVAAPAFGQGAPATPPATPTTPGTTATPATDGPAPAAGAAAADPKLDEARERYQRGLQIYNEGNYEAARAEFERAYHLAPSYKILYNIGLCYEQLGDYVQAQSILQKYLEIGGSEITPARRTEVTNELAQIRPRIAHATIRLNTTGVEIFVDDVCATDKDSSGATCGVTTGNTREVVMNPGRRRITARKSGYLPETQVVSVAGSDKVEVSLDLKPLPKLEEKKSNPWVLPAIIGWGLTAAGATTAIVAGVMTQNAEDEQTSAVNRFGVTRAELNEARDKTENLATITDVALIGTGVVAAASAYVTIRALRWKGESSNVNVEVGLSRVGIVGRF